MRYVNGEIVLPNNLLSEIQKYIQGGYLYIPSPPSTKKKWGERSGNREYIQNRNDEIRSKHKNGCTVKDLAEEFFLSVDSIKKIVYAKNK